MMSLGRAFSTVGFGTLASRILGFVRDILMAGLLGAGAISDAFFIALKLPNLFRQIFGEGALSVSFVPLYTELLEDKKEEEAELFASYTISFLMLVVVPLTFLLIIFMPFVLQGIALGYQDDPEQMIRMTRFARILFPYLIFISMTAILGAILNAHHHFMEFAFAPVFFNLCLIAALLLTYFIAPLYPYIGYLLSFAVFLSGLIQWGFVYRGVRRYGIRVRFRTPKLTHRMKQLFKLMGPGILSVGAYQIHTLVDVMLASFLSFGSISYLYYADRLYNLPFGIIGIAMGTALLPFLSKAIKSRDQKAFQNYFSRSFEASIFFALPAMIALIMIPDLILTGLFHRGAFTLAHVSATSLALAAYAIGLPAAILMRPYNAVYFANKNTKMPVYMSLIGISSGIILSLIFVWPLKHVGLALGTALASWIQFLALRYFCRKMHGPSIDEAAKRRIKAIILSSFILVSFLGAVRLWIMPIFPYENVRWVAFLLLGAVVGGGVLLYAGASYYFKAFDRSYLKLFRKRA